MLFGLLLVVAAAAAVLSFSALRDLALLCGFAPELAWLLPVVVDAGAAAGSLVWLGGTCAELARRFARALALTLLGLSVAANALAPRPGRLPAGARVVGRGVVSAIAPAVLGAVVHLAVLVGRAEPDVDDEPIAYELTADADEPTRSTSTACPAAGTTPRSPATTPTGPAELIAAGVGRRRLARELAITEYEARRLHPSRARPTTPTATRAADGRAPP